MSQFPQMFYNPNFQTQGKGLYNSDEYLTLGDEKLGTFFGVVIRAVISAKRTNFSAFVT
jgi:hypothetical protein